MLTSSLKEMSTDHMGNMVVMGGGGRRYPTRPFLQQASGSIFKDDLKGQQREMVFWLKPTHLKDKERIYNFFHVGPLLTQMCSVFLRFFAVMNSPYTQRAKIFNDNKKNKICTLFVQGQYMPHSIFLKYCPSKSPGIVESENFFLHVLHSFCIFGEFA